MSNTVFYSSLCIWQQLVPRSHPLQKVPCYNFLFLEFQSLKTTVTCAYSALSACVTMQNGLLHLMNLLVNAFICPLPPLPAPKLMMSFPYRDFSWEGLFFSYSYTSIYLYYLNRSLSPTHIDNGPFVNSPSSPWRLSRSSAGGRIVVGFYPQKRRLT